MRKLIITAVALVAFAAFAVPAIAGNGAKVIDMNNTPTPLHEIGNGYTGYNFAFWNGDGEMQDFAPTSYHGVTTPSGVYNQVLKGIVANDSGATVTYSANSGGPIPAGQQCWSFTTGLLSTDWEMTIDADGHYTLSCHFPKAA